MILNEITLKNRTVIVVLAIILIIAGAYSYSTIPKESNPTIEIPIFIVNTIYPGISPADMESLVTQPIERELQGINGVKDIRSTTLESVSSVVVEFDLGISLTEASQRVRERVDLARADLPPDVEEPVIIEIDLDDFPIMTVNLAADYPLSRLTEVADRLSDRLEAVSGVREVDVVGKIEREVQVNVNLDALNGYGIPLGALVGAIQNQNLTIPGGTIDVDRSSYLIRISGEFKDPDEINDLVILGGGGGGDGPAPEGLVYMRDVAEVVFGFKDRESFARLRSYKVNENGVLVDVPSENIEDLEVISLNIKKRGAANILETVEEVMLALENYSLPAGTQVVISGDQSEDVRTLIKDLENSIISGMLFVVLVLVFFLGIRNALLVGTAVPLSILVGFAVLLALGYTANFVILFSLIIALGLLVDNSIVVVENIYRFREMGYERFEAAKLGADEVSYALIAATSTLLAAFIPMTFWPGIIGQFMGYLPLTLIIVLLCSLFVALVLYPVLTGYLVKLENEKSKPYAPGVKKLMFAIGVFLLVAVGLANPITLIVTLLTIVFFYVSYKFLIRPLSEKFNSGLFPRMQQGYRDFLGWMLRRNYKERSAMLRNTFALSMLTIGALMAVMGLVIGLFSPAGEILAMVGGIFAGIGVLGIVIHFFEIMIRGGRISVYTGLITGIFIATVLGLVSIGSPVNVFTWIILMLLPLTLVILGLAGMALQIKADTSIIITDNRSLLLNAVLGLMIAIFGLFAVVPTGVEFFPETDPNRIVIELEGPIGMNVFASNEVAFEVQQRLYRLIDEDPKVKANIENIQINVGVAGDPFFGGGNQSPELSRLTVNVVDYGDRKEPSAVTMQKIRGAVGELPDIIVNIEGEQQGPPTGAPVNIEVSGEDFDEVVRITREITQKLVEASTTRAIPGLVDIRNNVSGGLPEYRILVDYERASRFGLNLADIAQTIRIANNGLDASKWRDGEDEYDIVVRLREEDRQTLESLRDILIGSPTGPIPLTAVADFEEGTGLGTITRLNLQRTATVEAQAESGFSGPQVLGEVQTLLAEYINDLPDGYTIKYTGESEDQEEAFGFLITALMVAFSLIFLVMLAKFNNLKSPLIIMTAVGLSLIGVLLGLILTRTPFGLMTFIGIISLAGIVCVNNVVLLDYVKQLTDKGNSKKEAIVEAGTIRFRPVILTALTTILGLVPLTFGINIDFVGLFASFDPNLQFGSESTAFWGPMGIAIISGLTFATFLTLVVVPVLYSVFDSVGDRLGKKIYENEPAV
ncbi:MAG: efflux RND transporter permease subunit [Balneolales bacterium]|nr:efflux RND transporter permease subunit [Balneolales bacterium]